VKGENISERLIQFAVRIIRLVQSLPKNHVNNHIAYQLLKSGTSPGANYEEARGAESTSDFVHKLKIALKELRESVYWLKVLRLAKILTANKLNDITTEGEELSRIIAQSIITAQKKK